MISLIIARTPQHRNWVERGYHQPIFFTPQHKSFHSSSIPSTRTGLQKQFQLKNKVLFFNFQAICIGVSVVYLASTLVFTYLFKEKMLGMIYGLQRERNFPCCEPNLRGYGERSHWPYKYHGSPTETRWIFILLKTCQVSLHGKISVICQDHWVSKHLWFCAIGQKFWIIHNIKRLF